MAEKRTKELGIRKVMGATVTNLVIILCCDFTKLVIMGLAVGYPIAWYLVSDYLSGFVYHTEISVWVFVLTGLALLGIALATVAYQSARSALVNPVESLRSE